MTESWRRIPAATGLQGIDGDSCRETTIRTLFMPIPEEMASPNH